MRLKHIQEVSFRNSELTNFETFQKANPELAASLTPDDVVLFVSMQGNQLVFAFGFRDVTTVDKKTVRVLESVRYRIPKGRWEPLLLSKYAELRGIKLDGMRKFEQYYKKLKSAND